MRFFASQKSCVYQAPGLTNSPTPAPTPQPTPSTKFKLQTSGECRHPITSAAGCADAAEDLSLSDKTVSDDGQHRGVSYDPRGCYLEGGNLKYVRSLLAMTTSAFSFFYLPTHPLLYLFPLTPLLCCCNTPHTRYNSGHRNHGKCTSYDKCVCSLSADPNQSGATVGPCPDYAVQEGGLCYASMDKCLNYNRNCRSRCQSGRYYESLPVGWRLAEKTAAVVANVVAKNSFGTHLMVFANGESWGTRDYRAGRMRPWYGRRNGGQVNN